MTPDTALSVFEPTVEPAAASATDTADGRGGPRPATPRSWRRRLRSRKAIAALMLLAVGIAFAAWWFGFRSDGASTATAATKQLATVTTGSMSTTVSAEGKVAAAQTDDLSFSSSGTVTAVNVQAGDAVKAGQVLATIDSASLESAVTSANANLASATATLSDDRSAGASSAQITADKASVTSATDSLATAKKNLEGAFLVATFDGTVASVDLTVGEKLGSSGTGGTTTTGSGSGSGQSSSSLGSSSSTPAFGGASSSSSTSSSSSSSTQVQVVSKGHYTVDLSIGSDSVDKVAVGQSAKLTVTTSSSSSSGGFPGFGGGGFPGFGGGSGTQGGSNNSSGSGATSSSSGATATGMVTGVSKVADASSGVAKYPVTISFDADSQDIYVGATVTGDISTDVRNNVVQVSSRAVTTSNGTSTVVVATAGTLNGPTETRTVKTGLTANGNTEITEGLKAGEKVAVTVPGLPSGFRPPTGGSSGSGGFQPPSGFQPPTGAGGGQ